MHSEGLQNLYSSPNIIRVIKSSKRSVKHVAHEGKRGNVNKL
jgi:hypothetical protein